MNTIKAIALAVSLLALSACKQDTPAQAPSDPQSEAQTALGRTVAKAMDEARKELATENISLNGDFNIRVGPGNARIRNNNKNRDDLPRGEITPEGELLIEGKSVALDDAQKQLSLAYRRDLLAIVEAGMNIGVQGADFGMRAARDAVVGIFKGNMDEVEKKIEAEAKQFEVAAIELCKLMPAVLASQDALAASVAEFKPYARMTQADVEDCGDGNWADADIESDDPAIATDPAVDPAAEADAAADTRSTQ